MLGSQALVFRWSILPWLEKLRHRFRRPIEPNTGLILRESHRQLPHTAPIVLRAATVENDQSSMVFGAARAPPPGVYSPQGFFVGQSCLSLNAHEDNWRKVISSELKHDYKHLPIKTRVLRKPRLEINELEELPTYFRFANSGTVFLLTRLRSSDMVVISLRASKGAPAGPLLTGGRTMSTKI